MSGDNDWEREREIEHAIFSEMQLGVSMVAPILA